MWFVKTPFSSNSDLDEKFKRICEEAADIRQDSGRGADAIVHVVRRKIEGGEPEGGRLPLAMTCDGYAVAASEQRLRSYVAWWHRRLSIPKCKTLMKTGETKHSQLAHLLASKSLRVRCRNCGDLLRCLND